MSFHRNAKLGLAGRHALVCAVEEGMTLKAAAVAFSVSPATAHRWWHRWREASEEARATLACLFDRSSRPLQSPRFGIKRRLTREMGSYALEFYTEVTCVWINLDEPGA